MKLTGCLIAATGAVVLAVPAYAQVDCANWNTEAFFKAAKASDVIRCLEAGAGLEVRDRSGKTPLRIAAEVGNVVALTTLAKAGADPNARSASAETPLHALASNGIAKTVKALLHAGADPNAPTARGITPLELFAAWNKDAETVAVLLEAGADLNTRDRQDGSTPLHTAARVGTAEIIAVLIEAGADPNALDRYRRTPWDHAREREALKGSNVYRRLASATSPQAQLDCVGWNTAAFFVAAEASEVAHCLEAGADLNAGGKGGGWPPLHTAAHYSQPAVVKTLVEAGADPNVRGDNGTPLHMAITYTKDKAEDHDRDAEVVKILLKAGADPTARTLGKWIRTPLHMAAAGGKLSVIAALLGAGADLEARTEDGETPLHVSTFQNQPAVVRMLLGAGADAQARSDDGRTPLHMAAASGRLSVITDLLEAGADLEAQTKDGRTPLHFAARNTYSNAAEVVALLLNSGADPNAQNKERKSPWDLAQRNRNLKNTGAFRRLKAGAEGTSRIEPAAPKPPVQLGMAPKHTPTHVQVDCANWNTAAFFKAASESDVTRCLEAGANPNMEDRSGFAPLHIVASVGNVGAVAALVNRGADLEAWADNGETPLHIAAAVDNPGVVAALANQGANLEARDVTGLTALQRAAARRSDRAVRALLKAGADPDARTEDRQTALHLAATIGSSGAVKALLEAGADPNIRARNGATPLDYVDSDTVRALLKAEGAVPAPALGPCANWNTISFFSAAKLSDVTHCLQVGADLEMRDVRGETPLYKATIHGTTEAVTALLQAGANPNARDVGCMTPLHLAAALWRSQAGRALLAGGADPGLREYKGKFPFDYIPDGIGTILRLQAKGLIRPGGQIGGRLQTEFYSKLYQGKFSRVRRLWSPHPIPPECSESGDPLSIPLEPRRNRPRVR